MAEPPNDPIRPGASPGKKELSMEARLLVAFILMGVILYLTPFFYKSTPPPKPAAQPAATPAAQPAGKPAEPAKSVPEPIPAALAAAKEDTFIVDTDLFRIAFSNRGAVVRSWVLKKYKDGRGRELELVNQAKAATDKAGFPFSLAFRDQKPALDLGQALYAARPSADGPGVDFEFSDGRVLSRKSFRFSRDRYLAKVSSEVIQNGVGIAHMLAWRGGFGDQWVEGAAASQRTLHFDLAQNKLIVDEAKVAKDGPVSTSGTFSFAGIQDTFFAAVFLPTDGASVEIRTYSDTVPPPGGGKEEPHVGAAVGGSGHNEFSLFVGPKDIDILRKVDPKLEQMVDFGWFAFIAKPLFWSLQWVNERIVGNYGWSIVLVTIVINIFMLPLKFSGLKKMKAAQTKMQALQPELTALKARYKNLGLRDPRRAEQNQEMMELYKKHGINPMDQMGGCVPMLFQIPFFFAFYKVLTVAIEMRGAGWLWVADLSRPETLPIRILPVTMIATQFALQKMTPSTSTDPTQQRMMMFMPLMLGFMFYSVSSGVVLYWLTGNVIGILQQWAMNRLSPAPAVEAKPAPKKRGVKK